ncbi:uncharacterized protein LOC115278379 isoform X1 [Suricata suricatta]|uniref:uncharacterized protein LOC115278379 isoform X1 n=1 Tax=Suricata suricatta TaxID=37032 RepID=UPI0011569007|nr:uncharacterized protein LOC115278379 isoform X1 [Suricata suricatta]
MLAEEEASAHAGHPGSRGRPPAGAVTRSGRGSRVHRSKTWSQPRPRGKERGGETESPRLMDLPECPVAWNWGLGAGLCCHWTSRGVGRVTPHIQAQVSWDFQQQSSSRCLGLFCEWPGWTGCCFLEVSKRRGHKAQRGEDITQGPQQTGLGPRCPAETRKPRLPDIDLTDSTCRAGRGRSPAWVDTPRTAYSLSRGVIVPFYRVSVYFPVKWAVMS